MTVQRQPSPPTASLRQLPLPGDALVGTGVRAGPPAGRARGTQPAAPHDLADADARAAGAGAAAHPSRGTGPTAEGVG